MSFININNREELNANSYTKQMIQSALYVTETKNVAKIKTLTEGLNRFTPLNEALTLFTDKLGAMSALSHAKVQLGGTLNEGQFSWMTQDSGEQIGSEKENTIDVWMYDNKGNVWYEKRYEGYGEFGGMDYYELVATMNGYTEEDLEAVKGPFKELRQLGIDLAFGKLKTKDKKGKTLFPALVTDPRYNWKRHDFTQEAESDPNQSWYVEPEYDEYEDEYDYDSDEYYESAKANIKFYKTITKKEWDKAQKDSKTIIDGTHYMMFLDDEKGTILAPVEVTESEDKEVNEGLPDSFLGLPLETFADYYAALDVALAIGIGGVMAGAVLAKLGLDAGVKLFKKGKKAVEDWYTKNGGEVTEGNAFGAARAEAIAKGEKEFTVDGETYPVEDVDKEDKENAEEFANEAEVNEMKKPKTWDTQFAMKAIDAYEAGEFDLKDDKSLADWEKEYNGGRAPKPSFETRDIIEYALETGKKPDGSPIKESVKINENWGTFGTPEAKVVIRTLNKALAKFEADLKKAHDAYQAAIKQFTTGDKKETGNKSGFNDSEGRYAVHSYTMSAIEKSLGMKEWGGSLDYKVGWMYEGKDWTRLMEDLGLTEGRSISKIQKEWGAVTLDMKQTVEEWKAAEGDRKSELLDKLKALTNQKKGLEKELDDAVGLKDADAELAESDKKKLKS